MLFFVWRFAEILVLIDEESYRELSMGTGILLELGGRRDIDQH